MSRKHTAHRSPAGDLYRYYVQPYSGWEELSKAARRGCINALLGVLVNPCGGTRLNQSPGRDHGASIQWTDFCKVECPRFGRRIIYRFISRAEQWQDVRGTVRAGPIVLIEAVGPHTRRGDFDDVYTRLMRVHAELPDDQGHARAGLQIQCCEPSELHDDDRMRREILDVHDRLLG